MSAILPRIIYLLEKGLRKEAEVLLSKMSPSEIVHILRRVGPERKAKIFQLLDSKSRADVLLLLSEEERRELLLTLSDKDIADIVRHLASDDACRILRSLKSERRIDTVLSYLPERKKRHIVKQLRYSKEVAGGIMQKEIVVACPEESVQNVLDRIKKASPATYTKEVFVIDEAGRLLGRAELEKLVTAEPSARIRDVMTHAKPVVSVTTDREEVVNLFRKHRCMSIPVIENNKLVGVITIDEALKIMEEEHAEDLFKMFSLEREERVFDPIIKALRNRTPWLMINLFTAFLAASVVNLFEDVLKTFVLLAIFMPIVAGEGGNATTQTMAIVVRSLALGEITPSDFFRVIKKEVIVAAINGLIVGIIAAMFAVLWKGSMVIAIALVLAMFINMMVAAFAGATIPLLLKRMGSDPASSSTVILTTFTDVFGFLSFLGIGAILLKLLGAV